MGGRNRSPRSRREFKEVRRSPEAHADRDHEDKARRFHQGEHDVGPNGLPDPTIDEDAHEDEIDEGERARGQSREEGQGLEVLAHDTGAAAIEVNPEQATLRPTTWVSRVRQ